MASAHPLSAPGENSSLQLFQVPITDVSILKSRWVDYEQVQSGTNHIEFVIILGDPGAASRDEGIFVGESLL